MCSTCPSDVAARQVIRLQSGEVVSGWVVTCQWSLVTGIQTPVDTHCLWAFAALRFNRSTLEDMRRVTVILLFLWTMTAAWPGARGGDIVKLSLKLKFTSGTKFV